MSSEYPGTSHDVRVRIRRNPSRSFLKPYEQQEFPAIIYTAEERRSDPPMPQIDLTSVGLGKWHSVPLGDLEIMTSLNCKGVPGGGSERAKESK